MAKITQGTVRKASPKKRVYELSYTNLPGFTLRVLPSGKKVFYARLRVNGKDRRVRIGTVTEVSLEAARAKALDLLNGRQDVEATKSEVAQRIPPPAYSRIEKVEPPAPKRRVEATSTVPTLREFSRKYIKLHVNARIRPSTAQNYRRLIRLYLVPYFGGIPLDKIEYEMVETMHSELHFAKTAANASVRILSHMYTKATDWKLLPRTCMPPTKGIKMYRERMRERFLSPAERKRLEEVLREGEKVESGRKGHIRWSTAAAIRLLSLTGMRRSEVLGLQWSMVDGHHRMIHLPDSKTGQRVVPVSSHVIELLEELRGKHADPGCPWVLTSRSGERFRGPSLAASWRIIRKRAGLEDVKLHDLRHSAASDAIMSGVPLAVVGKILGHASPTTTARYAHIADRVVTEAVEQMAAAIVAASG